MKTIKCKISEEINVAETFEKYIKETQIKVNENIAEIHGDDTEIEQLIFQICFNRQVKDKIEVIDIQVEK